MENPPSPQILEPTVIPEITAETAPAPQARPPKKKNLLPLIAIVIVILVIALISSSRTASPSTTNIGATATTTPTPTGIAISTRVRTQYATDSAFIQFENTVDALPKVIQTAVLLDSTALPPVLDLKLGF